uniref:Ni/Fe hydrogenase subunit gamma n=1 Tax=Schlesneria paludicola TaxID=360056 RepID=A0A7C2K0X9_9PLAN
MTPHHDPWQFQPMEIRAITPEYAGVSTYDLSFVEPVAPDAYRFVPGQFNMLYLPGVGESAISLSGSCEERGFWRHTVRVAGKVTQTLSHLQVGDQLGVRGPFGAGWPIDDWRGGDVVLVAGGIGLAPLRPVIYELLRRRSDFVELTLVFGARDPQTLLYPAEFADWEARGMTVHITVDRATSDWTGHVGVVTLLLDRLALPRPPQTFVAICGPEVMMKYAAISAEQRGITADRVWTSMERNMQCAVGLCGHCQLGPDFICKDGPVFRYDRLRGFLAVEAL